MLVPATRSPPDTKVRTPTGAKCIDKWEVPEIQPPSHFPQNATNFAVEAQVEEHIPGVRLASKLDSGEFEEEYE